MKTRISLLLIIIGIFITSTIALSNQDRYYGPSKFSWYGNVNYNPSWGGIGFLVGKDSYAIWEFEIDPTNAAEVYPRCKFAPKTSYSEKNTSSQVIASIWDFRDKRWDPITYEAHNVKYGQWKDLSQKYVVPGYNFMRRSDGLIKIKIKRQSDRSEHIGVHKDWMVLAVIEADRHNLTQSIESTRWEMIPWCIKSSTLNFYFDDWFVIGFTARYKDPYASNFIEARFYFSIEKKDLSMGDFFPVNEGQGNIYVSSSYLNKTGWEKKTRSVFLNAEGVYRIKYWMKAKNLSGTQEFCKDYYHIYYLRRR